MVKVQYKPVHKYQHQQGMLTKSQLTVYEQKVIVKNTKLNEVDLTLLHSLPKSTDDKIKIKLIAPDIHQPTNGKNGNDEKLSKLEPFVPGARINSSNTLAWGVVIKPQEDKELVIKYSVECPSAESVTFVETF